MEPAAISEITYYQKQKQAINAYKLPQDIKPCMAILLRSKNIEGQGFRRSEYGLMIATELRDLRKDQEQIEAIITKWNFDYVDPPLQPKDIRGILKQCFKTKQSGKYAYKFNYCNGQKAAGLQEWGHCIGHDMCYYYRQKNSNFKYYDYIAAGWQHILTAREQLLLFAIQRLEKAKKAGGDRSLIVSYRELEHQTGTSKRYIKDDLMALEAYGIIKVEIGKPQRWAHTGTTIKRIIPPIIPKRFIGKPKDYKKHIKQALKDKKAKSKLRIQS